MSGRIDVHKVGFRKYIISFVDVNMNPITARRTSDTLHEQFPKMKFVVVFGSI